MQDTNKKTEKLYIVICIIISAAYAVWTAVFMRGIILEKYAGFDARTVDGITHNDITGFIGREWLYPVWVILSCACLLSFALAMHKLYFGKETKSDKIFCLVSLIVGFAFITWYGFLKNPFEYTASMIGLDYPWCFKLWGVFASVSVFCNIMYMYRKFGCSSPTGFMGAIIGTAAIYITINVPSAGEELILTDSRCMSHWSGALIFAFGCVAPIIIFLVGQAKTKSKKSVALCVIYSAVVALMLVLLATVGKNGLIENVPMWATYVVFFLVNFTSLFDSEIKENKKEKELARV